MISPIGSDPLESFWNLGPWWTGIIALLAGPVAIYLIELARSVRDKNRAPYGLAIFRWTMVWVGDSLLAGTIATVTAYYQRVQIESSPFTGLGFFVFCGVAGVLLSVGFIIFEEMTNAYPKGHKRNANRAYHCIYFAWMAYMLIGSLRSLVWITMYREEVLLVVLALAFFVGYCVTIAIDLLGYNRIWQAIERRYPERTKIP